MAFVCNLVYIEPFSLSFLNFDLTARYTLVGVTLQSIDVNNAPHGPPGAHTSPFRDVLEIQGGGVTSLPLSKYAATACFKDRDGDPFCFSFNIPLVFSGISKKLNGVESPVITPAATIWPSKLARLKIKMFPGSQTVEMASY